MNTYSIHEFLFDTSDPNGNPGPWKLSSIVMSDGEFDLFIQFLHDSMRGTFNQEGVRMQDEHVEALREARHIPMIARGTKTEPVFQRYGVDSKFMSIIVRGEGTRIFEELTRNQPRGQA